MPGKHFRWSLRLRVLAPTVAILCIAISGLIFTVLQVQTQSISDTVLSVNGTLETANGETQKQFKTMSAGINKQLKVMAKQAGESLSTAMGYALDREKEAYVEETDAHLRETADSLARVLSKVAPPAVFNEDFPTLLSYSRAVGECPNVVYALFLNKEERPLIHDLKRDDPIIKKFLEAGEGEDEVAKVIHASRQDQSVLVVERSIDQEGVNLGKVLLCVDMAPAKGKAEEMSARFATLILENRQMVDSVLEMETSDVAGKLEGMLRTLGAKSKAFANTVERAISHSFKGMSEKTGKLAAGLGGVSIVLVFVALFFVVSRVTKAILRLSSSLYEGSQNVVAGTTQVAAASQSLAEGASGQAASIEETSSSLEEMSAMTKQNAENASQADNLMKEANQVVTRANETMGQLTVSMKEITGASQETSKIIKTIDEIAFQTNLLALNAAVEAARAGEAGAGFAVVAGEVRNLAMRAAEAAKNTAALIEGTVKKVKEGSDLVSRTNDAFGEVAVSAAKVGGLVAEIAAASNEQAQGIEQVNKAVAEMDKVVQQNAASAEESASASEEMNAQAEQMKGIVGDLVALVGGSGKAADRKQYAVPRDSERDLRCAPIESGKKEEGEKARNASRDTQVVLRRGKEVTPEQVIPLKDEEFQDF